MQPNIILINADDLGYGDLSCYGSKKHKTEAIDSLCETGIKFTNYYAAPLCSASRTALLTGCYSTRLNMPDVLFPGSELGLHPAEKTIGSILQDAGYKTMVIGKWHVGDQPDFLPLNHGFDKYYGLPYSNDMGRMHVRINNQELPPLPLIKDNEVIEEQPDQTTITSRYVEKSIEFIRENKNQPFFLYLAHMHVHLPHLPSPEFLKLSENGEYGAGVMAIDWSVKSIVYELKKQGLYNDTIIIFTSDNGSRNDFGESNGSLRDIKGTFYDGGSKVPFIFSYPKLNISGQSDNIIKVMDLLPTLTTFAKGNLPKDRILDGIDFSTIILNFNNQNNINWQNKYYYYINKGVGAIRLGNYKLHLFTKERFSKEERERLIAQGEKPKFFRWVATEELYDLSTDPGEINNIYSQYPDIVAKIKEEFEICRNDIGDSLTNTIGLNTRECGYVKDPVTLTHYNKDHPYMVALYDGKVG